MLSKSSPAEAPDAGVGEAGVDLMRFVKPPATVRSSMIPSWSLVERMAPLVPLIIQSLVEGLLVGLWTLSRLWRPGEWYE